jgi:TfoX/Sxy family transcriptional regulator of competence genes
VGEQRWQELVETAVGGDVTPGTMFGSKGLRTGKKFFAVWWQERLVLKLPAERVQELVARNAGEPFEPMAGRPMKGWIVVADEAEWSDLTSEARDFVESQQR